MSKIFTLNAVDWKKVGIKFLLVLLGAVALFLEQSALPILQDVIQNPAFLAIALALNTSLVDLIRKFISDEQGNVLGIGSK
jgi:hypothetical protein